MPRRIDRNIARRAVDAWFRRLLYASRRRRGPAEAPSVDRAVERAQRDTREALIDVVVEAGLRDDVCQDARRGKQILARRLHESSDEVEPQIDRFERVIAGNPAAERRYRPMIESTRELLDPGSSVTGELLQEICLVVSLSRRDRVPWARRR